MSTFHWHIVDSQSFPLVVPGYEGLSANGSYSSEEIYTPSQIADIVKYANMVNNFPHLQRAFTFPLRSVSLTS